MAAHAQSIPFGAVPVAAHVEPDENGAARYVARTLADVVRDRQLTPRAEHVPQFRILAIVDEPPALRRRAFAANPFCCQCDERLDSPDAGGIVPTDEGPRLAHRDSCYAAAMNRHQPELALRAALGKFARKVSA